MKKNMRIITKDEARILGLALYLALYDMADGASTKENANKIAKKLKQYADELEEYGKDKRRESKTGKALIDDMSSVLKRYCEL
jgi:hypothetical protein